MIEHLNDMECYAYVGTRLLHRHAYKGIQIADSTYDDIATHISISHWASACRVIYYSSGYVE